MKRSSITTTLSIASALLLAVGCADEPDDGAASIPASGDPAAAAIDALIVLVRVDTASSATTAALTVDGIAPTDVRFLLADRLSGAERDRVLAEPDAPRARLERYLVVRYPDGVDLTAIRDALRGRAAIEMAELDEPVDGLELIRPGDPGDGAVAARVAPETAAAAADAGSWHLDALRLRPALDRQRGRAYVTALDNGYQPNHPYLPPLWLGMSFNWTSGTLGPGIDEVETAQTIWAGHGTHVTGLFAGLPNPFGGQGACPGCSYAVSKISGNGRPSITGTAAALVFLSEKGGLQVFNMSFGSGGYAGPNANGTCPNGAHKPVCEALASAVRRDVVVVAASGNERTAVNYPARDPRVIAVGGIEAGLGLWNQGCVGTQCGTNFGPQQALVAPARQVMSTMYQGRDWNASFGLDSCGDSFGPGTTSDGYGLCTGTSMAAPLVAAIAGLVRSTDPLLNRDQVRSVLTSTTYLPSTCAPSGCNPQEWGTGIADADAAVRATQGKVGGRQLGNRATPLFGFRIVNTQWGLDATSTDLFYTSTPQMAASDLLGVPGDTQTATSVGAVTNGYSSFPNALISRQPRAGIYVFTGQAGLFDMNARLALLPLKRHVKFIGGAPHLLDHGYSTTPKTESALLEEGYTYEGTEGYVFAPCRAEPACIPAGAVRIYSAYNAVRADYAVFTEAEQPAMAADGYTGSLRLLGYAFANKDFDSDGLVDGFETQIGTSPGNRDSDGDGRSDGAELNGWPRRDPLIWD